jgi:4-diphosphocytidyl-2-C-methyl-D-erythritol kinase
MEKRISSYGKINLGLWVLGKRFDNYHEIYTLMHTISLKDEITIKPSSFLKVKSTSPLIPEDEGNIVYKAVKLYEEYTRTPQNYEIFIQKNIPVGAGLGGGSSNAAAVLKAINELSENPIPEEELYKIAEQVGADVPFFIKGGMAIARGKGEKLKHFKEPLKKKGFVIYPNIQVSTERIYSLINEKLLTKEDKINIIDSLLAEYEIDKYLESLENTLGEVAKELYPEIAEVVNTLSYLGYKGYISGSGSSVFSFGSPSEELKKGCELRNWKIFEVELI